MGDPTIVCKSLGGTATPSGGCALSPPDEKANLKDWQYLLNFRPSAVKGTIKQRFPDNPDPGYHAIEDGYGACNFDFYAVQITKMPSIAGTELRPSSLIYEVRSNLIAYLDQSIAVFEAYDETLDGAVWSGKNVLGVVRNFAISTGLMGLGGVDNASVICAETADDHWIFSTLPTPRAKGHPVSGNRHFGFGVLRPSDTLSDIYQKAGITFNFNTPDGTARYFFTRGVDRCTAAMDRALSDTVFAGGHAIWCSLMKNVLGYILKNGGEAFMPGYVSERWDWDFVRQSGLWYNPDR